MPLVINSNISSLNSQRQLVKSGMEMDQAMERLSSGKRINSAADDAAGLAISNRQTSQIRGLDRAVANANDGVSLIQTAEGAMDESTNILQRMRELSIQSANGIYSDADRTTLNAEVQQLVSELDRIAATTSFNGQKILDGSLGSISLQVGSEANQTIDFSVGKLDAKTLGLGSQSGDLIGASITAANLDDIAHNDILINGQSIIKAGDTALDFTGTDTSRDLIDAINNNVNGVSASILASTTSTVIGDGVLSDAESVSFALTNTDGTTTTIAVGGATENLSELVNKINDLGAGRISASVGDDGQVTISASDAENLAITDAGGALGTIAASEGQLVLTSENGDPITVARGATGSYSDLTDLGFRENTEPGTIEGIGITAAGAAVAWGSGDISINGVKITDVANTDSLQGKINAINDISGDTGVSATAFSSAEIETSGATIAAAAFDLNGVTVTNAGTTAADIVTAINAETNETGVSAVLNGTKIELEGDVAGIVFAGAAIGTVFGASTLTTSNGTISAATVAAAQVVEGGIKLTSENGSAISVDVAAAATLAEHGLLDSNVTGAAAFGSSISSISVGTQSGAQKAIGVIDNALDTINSLRSDLGAISNRLDFTVSNLMNISENTSAARSRIMDADFAAETAALSRAQVLQQASQAMLAQANAAPAQVLSLLR